MIGLDVQRNGLPVLSMFNIVKKLLLEELDSMFEATLFDEIKAFIPSQESTFTQLLMDFGVQIYMPLEQSAPLLPSSSIQPLFESVARGREADALVEESESEVGMMESDRFTDSGLHN